MGQGRTDLKNLNQLLTLPGSGVFTVHSGAEKKEKLLKAYYGTTSAEKAKSKWEKALANLTSRQPLLLGIPSDNGGGIQRGANWGPLAIRQEILNERKNFSDVGDVRVIPHLLHDKYLNDETIKLCRKALYGKVNKLPVSPLSIAEFAVAEIYKKLPDARILGLGGDHSTSYPLVKAWLASRKQKKKAALLHFDAHTDLLDRRMGIDICFGTWTFQILKDLSSTDHIVQIGIRASGKDKKHWKNHLGVEQYWAQDVKKWGTEKVYQKLKSHYQKLGVEEIYISFDIDALDIKYASATGTPEAEGLLPTDCAAIIMMLAQDFKITGADLMEVAPYVSPEGVSEANRQSSLMVAGDMAKVLLRSLST
ncbi:MAG: arginase family protein [Bdellovibrionales bacterium]|nr:arginase family protein [Bdellovibrionales bacterium]